MKRLLVVADDFGLTSGINEGIAQTFHGGILTSTSFLTNTIHFDESVQLLAAHPGLKVGIHLSLVEVVRSCPRAPSLPWWATQAPFELPGPVSLPAWFAGRIRVSEVEAEWRAQIRRAVDAGVRLVHLDSHQHLHVLPGLWTIAMRLAREFSIPRLRRPREAAFSVRNATARRLVHRVLSALAPGRPRPGPVACCDHFFGVSQTGNLETGSLVEILRRVPEGWSELITHPGRPDEELGRDYPWGYHWERELEALTSERARQEIQRLGIQLDRP